MPKIKFTIITLFKETLEPYLNASMMWKAKENGIAEFNFVDLRNFGLGPHKKVDDTIYGGGDGMLLMCEPVFNAIESVKKEDEDALVYLPTPAGKIWEQKDAKALADVATGDRDISELFENKTKNPRKPLHIIILCPHYEGYDERILTLVDRKFCIGKYVLTGGELPALILIDSIVRLIPGVLGGEMSAEIESFSDEDNIEFPQYTKPADFRGMKVPDVLLSGNHGEIDKWRESHSK
ncbi:tRNA (guanine(37)-N(1))-methyltransferase [Candidatus Saccharibacteria bacterium]|nr:tRNA (guanine(37)-N(1))-methyltransferase [Candidatus Saccharibacteria bacterium]